MANKNTFTITIGAVEYTSYISYPVEIIDKRLAESFNFNTITLNRMTTATPISPNQRATVQWFIDDTLYKTFYTILISDAVEKIGVTSFYIHKLNLMEYAYYLEMVALPDMTITRIIGIYEPTLSDVVTRILATASLDLQGAGLGIVMSTATNTLLDAILSPEWTFTRMTVIEALRMVFGYAKVVPVMDNFTTLGFTQVFATEEVSTKLEGYGKLTQAFNPTSYRTRLTSNVSNFIAGDETAAITEPANGWMSPRSPDGYEISADNVILPTSRPIYMVEKLELAQYIYIGRYMPAGSILTWEAVPHDLIPMEWFIDPADGKDFLYEEDVYNTRLNTETFGERGGSVYYKQGKKNILGLSYRSPSKWTWIPTKQAWNNIVDHYADSTRYFTLVNFIKSEYVAAADAAAKAYWTSINGESQESVYYLISFDSQSTINDTPDPADVKAYDLQFRITYVPYVETTLYTYRERKTDILELLTTQFYNQQANVISSKVLGDLHDRVSKSNTGDEQDLMFVHKLASDMLYTGYKTGNYVITSGSHTINMYGIISHYNLDQYYLRLNTYVAVLEKWRQFSIPSENVVRRQITLNRFAKFATSVIASTYSTGLHPEFYLGDDTAELKMMRFAIPAGSNIVVPTTSFAFNNALMWEATFEGNANAGNKSAYLSTTKRFDEPVKYTDINGRISNTPTITFFNEFPAEMTLVESQALPISPLIFTANAFYNQSLGLTKDSREQLSISLQLHHVDTTGIVYLNHNFSNFNGLTGGVGLNSADMYIALLDTKPYGQETISSSTIIKQSASTLTEVSDHIVLPTITNDTTEIAYATALLHSNGDGTYKVLYWTAETVALAASSIQLYINFDAEY